VILGVDPGSLTTGFGVIEVIKGQARYIASGYIRTKADELSQRLLQIYRDLCSVITMYSPSQVAIEKVFVKNNVDSALKLGQARGAALVAVANHHLPLAEYEPRLVKKTVTGYGAADKNQIKQMTRLLLGLSTVVQTDAADALAIALCHASHLRSYS
jgi:crossover junction endodeoxyribonuclease RuvC